MLLTPPPHPYTHHASVNCHPGEVFNYFKYKLVGRHKDIWKLALEESQMGTTGSIWRANDETFYEQISQRGRGGSFPGLEMIKIAADSNIEKVAFLLQLVQDPARLQWPSLTSSYERSYSTYAIQPKIHWNNEQTPPRREALPGGGGVGGPISPVWILKRLAPEFIVAYCRLCRHCRDFILRVVDIFWVMSLVRLYPGWASGESFLFVSLKKLELTDALLSHI